MRVLLFTQYYRPEITAAAMRTEAFVDGLVARGHEVGVVCEVPSHPQGVIDPAYRGRMVFRSEEDGAKVRRVWVYARPSKTAVSRIANYASYATFAAAAGFRASRPDVVLASSPPLPVGAPPPRWRAASVSPGCSMCVTCGPISPWSWGSFRRGRRWSWPGDWSAAYTEAPPASPR